jgi:Phytanoyl-CoA dioxygenase (PhyH)
MTAAIASPILTPEHIATFRQQGYLRVPGAIDPVQLNALRLLFDRLCAPDHHLKERGINIVDGRELVCSIEYICRQGQGEVLALLGNPILNDLATALCGEPPIPVQDFAVIKMLGDTAPVLWHRDMYHQRRGRAITMGIYLDDACSTEGALRVVPGSHASDEDICTLSKAPKQAIEMQAGDVLLHDMMLVHGSAPLSRQPIRRVLYFEWLTEAMFTIGEAYPIAVMQQRQALHQLARQYWEALAAGKDAWEATDAQQRLEVLYAAPVHGKPSLYCIEKNGSISAEGLLPHEV